jgi:hypothetical protein
MTVNHAAKRLIVALPLLCAGGAAWAQPAPAPSGPPGGAGTTGNPNPPGYFSGAGDSNEPEGGDTVTSARQAPVLLITSVEVIRAAHPPELDIIRVRGLTPTSGWGEPSLKPLIQGVPSDGILDLLFVADAPPTNSAPDGFTPIAMLFPLLPGEPYHGVRVRGAYNAVTVTSIPGYSAAQLTMTDCANCVGKYFVPTGGALPAGKTDADVVRQESLPPGARIVGPDDGVRDTRTDPTRLTIVVDKTGRILDAAWD